jgi:virginiamycin B lyase
MGPAGDGNLYVTDVGSPHVFRVSLQGSITAVATSPALTDITASIGIGPDNQIWFTEAGASVDRMTTAGVLSRFPTAHPVGGQTITKGPDGNVWFTEYGSNFIGRVALPGGVVSEFPVPVGRNPFGLTFASDGRLWATVRGTPDQIVSMTVSGANLINPTSIALLPGSLPGPIRVGPSGNLWFSEYGGNRLGFVTPAGVLTEAAVVLSADSGPDGATFDAARNVIWFSEFNSGKIGRITLNGSAVAAVDEFPTPTPSSGAQSVVLDSSGNVWFVGQLAQKIGRFVP